MKDFPRTGSHLHTCPPPDRWSDWVEFDANAWPRRVERHYQLIPTICFNCEAGCGLLAYMDRDSGAIRKFEGNPFHPGSRGRNCAKGPATLNQVYDPERILYPLKRSGKRGSGQFVQISWPEVIQELAARIRTTLVEKRGHEIMYHVGRPGHDGYMDRVLQSWGIDGHNSHTNVCSAAARLGYALWQGADRPSPDHANARFILLLSSHLETGHYFNPHAQRIMEGRMNGAKLAVIDPRLSNTASMADFWLPSFPGSEAAVLLAMANVILTENRFDSNYLKNWVNWQDTILPNGHGPFLRFEDFLTHLKSFYSGFSPEFAEQESGVSHAAIVTVARQIADAGSQFSSHIWRGAASGNLGGWQVARALVFLHVLTGSLGTRGGVLPNVWNKFVARPFKSPPAQNTWNELLFPLEWPLSHHELSYLLPHFLKEGRGRLDTYFTRVYNPIWTNPDGLSWLEMLTDESQVGCHVCLTPIWSESAWFADYVLPMGVGAERHDLMSQETHAGRWIGFRQPVFRVFQENQGKKIQFTYEANPGEVWEEDEFWIELSWQIDADGSLGIRSYYESPFRPGEKITVSEYYRYIFENSVPGLPQAAERQGLTPLEYMRKYGAFEISTDQYLQQHSSITEQRSELVNKCGTLFLGDKAVGIELDGKAVIGNPTPSRKLEFHSPTLAAWRWPEFSVPTYIRSHVHPEGFRGEANDADPQTSDGDISKAKTPIPTLDWPHHARGATFVLLPTFRLPTLIHSRSGNAKWLAEISHRNPLWISTVDAEKLGDIKSGDLVKVHTEIGYFVIRAWITEGIRPGVLACSHHIGRWRLQDDVGTDRWCSALVDLKMQGPGQWMLRQIQGIRPFESSDKDSSRIWWNDAGVHQNLTFPVHPDPVSGMHCWHQVVKAEKAGSTDQYGDVFVDTNRAHSVYQKWRSLARPGPGPEGLRRPLWFSRAVRPDKEAYYVKKS